MNISRLESWENGNTKYALEIKKLNVIATLINDRNFQDEMEIRVTKGNERFSIRGHKVIMNAFTFEDFKNRVLYHLRRNELLRSSN